MNLATVTVQVPASTSNLGSGFDTLGLALQRRLRMRVTRIRGKRGSVEVLSGTSAKARDIVCGAARLFFGQTGKRVFGIQVELGNEVPVGRGLGASGALRVGILLALNRLAGTKLSRVQVLQLATTLEGHPDNASPALFGGFTVSGVVNDIVRCLHFPVHPQAKFVTLIPNFQIDTEKARRLVPGQFSKADTIHSLNRAALIVAAFAQRTYDELRGLFDDRVHQPSRTPLIPELLKVIRAGEHAGAVGGWLSGSRFGDYVPDV